MDLARRSRFDTMPFSFLAREAGRVHVCGHRGHSLCYPENTMPAFEAAKAYGATTVEADIVLTADAEPIVLHDRTLDRTTDGRGFAADLSFVQIGRLDAGGAFNPRFAGTPVPTLAEVLDWAKRAEMGLFLEIKEAEWPDLAVDRVVALAEATGTADRVTVISFDHVLLNHAAQRNRGIATQAITHARHADIVGVVRACGARSVSIELDMFHPADAQALHEAGFSIRLSLPGPDVFAAFCRGRRDIVPRVVRWIADGLIDAISGDDVPFLAGLVARAGCAG